MPPHTEVLPSAPVPTTTHATTAATTMASPKLDLANVAEVVPGRLYYATSSRAPSYGMEVVEPSGVVTHLFSTDHSLVYWNFWLDFGPLNLGQLYRFMEALDNKLATVKADRVVYYSAAAGQRQANSVFLMASYAMLRLGRTPEDALAPFAHVKLPPFHDATQGPCTYRLTVLDCLRGMHRSRELGFLDLDAFDVEEYEHFEKVESGDLSWVFPGRFLAFAGPHDVKSDDETYPTCVPEDYHEYFLARNVRTVIRLNKRYYDENRFRAAGIAHEDLYYPDGSCPSDAILNRFIEMCEARADHAIAVHCKAGLGRTGTCIGAFAMKHWGYTAAEVIGWLRVARPGSVIGPQQFYLEAIEPRMHAEGQRMRAAALASPPLPAAPTPAPPPLPPSARELPATSRGGKRHEPSFPIKSLASSVGSASSGGTASSLTSADDGDEEQLEAAGAGTQGDFLLMAKVNSPGAPRTRHSLRGAADAPSTPPPAAPSGSASGGAPPPGSTTPSFSALRSVARKLYAGSSKGTTA